MQGKIILTPPKQLYHLSLENHNNEWFSPRIPLSVADAEDKKIKRICFSPHISKAFRALCSCHKETLYVHVPDKLEMISKKA